MAAGMAVGVGMTCVGVGTAVAVGVGDGEGIACIGGGSAVAVEIGVGVAVESAPGASARATCVGVGVGSSPHADQARLSVISAANSAIRLKPIPLLIPLASLGILQYARLIHL